MVFKINGDIVSDEYADIYDYFEIPCTSPKKVSEALSSLPKGDRLEVKINSGGGMVMAGQEIYSTLRGRKDVDIEVESIAASAASLIAMAGHSTISPAGLIMIHDVSMSTSGNKNELKKDVKTLETFDEALASAYAAKTGKSQEEILSLMDKETWLPAAKAVELGFIDAISEDPAVMTASIGQNLQVTPDMVARYKAAKEEKEKEKADIIADLDSYGRA
ncbi:MAG: Clp protease ClpP [Lachnospiraceae bacterium]|nr:Clp protease ClpP [Lachnospiraceae bacterium]